MECCKKCRWAEWQLTDSGRRKFTSPGKCLYPLPPLPSSMADYRGRMPEKNRIFGIGPGECPVMEAPPKDTV